MTLPIPRGVLAQHVAVLGKTRSGKSSVMRLLVEDLLERRQPVCIVDPKGDWYGIKLAADGKGPGYPVVIFGGEHADIPINEGSGAAVAELFATGNRPCLIDLGGWMVGPRTRFWIEFASTLFKHTKGERWLAVDEFHNFAAKGKIESPEAGKMLHWSNRLASEGLGKGLAMLFASQRPQKVHNDSLTSAETLIAMRVLHPSDRGAISDWIKGCGDADGSQVLNSLAQLERGEGWAWSPEIGFGPKRVKFPLFHTYDSFRAQTVEDTRKLKGWADVDIDEVKAKFAATIEKAKAEDPKELRRQLAERDKRIRTLEKAAHSSGAAKPVESIKRVEVPVLKEGQLARVEKALARLTEFPATLSAALARGLEPLIPVTRELAEAVRQAGNGSRPVSSPMSKLYLGPAPSSAISARPRVQPSARVQTSPRPPIDGNVRIRAGARRMMEALARRHPVATSWAQVGQLAGIATSGGTFSTYQSDLRKAGYIVEDRDGVQLTAEGWAFLGQEPGALTAQTTEEMLQLYAGVLRGGARRMIEILRDVYPERLTRADLGQRANVADTGGTFSTYLSDLNKAGLVDVGRDDIGASELLMNPAGAQ